MGERTMQKRSVRRPESSGKGASVAGPRHAQLVALSSTLNTAPTAQRMAATTASPIQRAPNQTGLPDGLKAGVERLSGLSMDHVRVHYNSPKPAQLSAHAYAQGGDIHIAPGQQRHLPHEAWHIVQQAQGRVRATAQAKSVSINDDRALEREAEVMGARTLRMGASSIAPPVLGGSTGARIGQGPLSRRVVQRNPETTEVVGLTHLVTPVNGSIYAGIEGPEVVHGTELTIETHDRILSRRGPNQEIHGEADRVGQQIYCWVRVSAIAGHAVDRLYVREDAVTSALPVPEGVDATERRERPASFNREAGAGPKKKKAAGGAASGGAGTTSMTDFKEGLTAQSLFRDWYHDIAGMLAMLVDRKDLSEPAIAKLLKYYLMRFQLQAPYSLGDMAMVGRQSSPLVNEDYARGMRTKLWMIATQIQRNALFLALVGQEKKKNEKTVREVLNKYYVVSTPSAFSVLGKTPEICPKPTPDLTKTLSTLGCFYIPSLRLQLIPYGNLGTQELERRVDSHMGGRGQRSSPTESASVVAGAMAGMIKAGNVADALTLIEKEFRKEAAGQGSASVLPKTLLSPVKFDNQMLVAPYEHDGSLGQGGGRWLDPLLSSTRAQLAQLGAAYGELFDNFSAPSVKPIPFLFRSNFAVFHNLVGGNPVHFFGLHTPAQVTAGVTDALERAAKCVRASRDIGDNPVYQKKVFEIYYQLMQALHEAVRFQLSWHGTDAGALLDRGIRQMLPSGAPEPTSTHVAAHGLAMIDRIYHALEQPKLVGVLKSSYYETAGVFDKSTTVETVKDDALLRQDLIVLEPHPNNAEDRRVEPHEPIKLLKLLKSGSGHHTLMVDVTLNHLGEDEIDEMLKVAAPLIESGRLNLILLQSGTKFLQHGMDIAGIGIAVVFNKAKNWVEFNKAMGKSHQELPEDDTAYLGQMLTTNKDNLGNYLAAIRSNTRLLKALLLDRLGADTALEVTFSSDDRTVYVAIAPTQKFIQKFGSQAAPGVLTPEAAMKAVYSFILIRMAHLSLVGRPSFGFNLTNLGECLTTVRITPGVEEETLITAYAGGLATLSAELWDNPALLSAHLPKGK